MITHFFPKKDKGMQQPSDQVVARSDADAPSSDPVVDSVVRAVMQHESSRKRKHAWLSEQGLRTFVQNVLSDKTPLLCSTGPNPASPPPCTLPQLLHRFFSSPSSSTSPATFAAFYNSTKPLFAPLCDAVVCKRQQQHVDTFFQGDVEAGEGGGGSKRRRTERLGGSSVPATTCLILGPHAEVSAPDEWQQAHLVMRDQVLSMQTDGASPPPSPRAPLVKSVVKLTESEQLQCSVLRASRGTIPKTTAAADYLHMLFHTFGCDASPVQLSYTPPFDRNDLFLTNSKQTRMLLALEQAYTREAGIRKQGGGTASLRDLEVPAVYIVAIRYTGPLAACDNVTATYVTWALAKTLVVTSPLSAAPQFLEDVLSGAVRCNDAFTDFIDSVARYSPAEGALWKRRFELEVLDSSGGAISEQTLPGFVALVDFYCEQHGGVGKSKGHVGLNLMQHHHARHRLIYEAGSLSSYRVMWQCNKFRDTYVTVHEKALLLAKTALSTVRLFWRHLVATVRSTHEDVSTGTQLPQLHSLAKLFLDTVYGFEEAVREAARARAQYVRSAEERKEVVTRTHAEASVQEYMDGCAVSSGLQALFHSLQADMLGDIPSMHSIHGEAAHVQAARLLLLHTWFYPCAPAGEGTGKRWLDRHDEAMSARNLQLLHALHLVDVWSPEPWEERDGARIPAAPPRKLDPSLISTNFKSSIRVAHVDKNVRSIHEGRTTAEEQHEHTQRLLKARDFLRSFCVDSIVDEALTHSFMS